MKVIKITQPKGSNQCGQAIIAMLGNISIHQATKIIGKTGCTRTKDIIQALEKIGLKAGSDRLLHIPKNWIKPRVCLVHIGFGNHWKKHWTLWIGDEDCFYDPAHKSKKKENIYNDGWARMLSYLEIRKK